MITLYGSGQSRSFRALWALEEAELSYEYKSIKLGSAEEGGSQTAAHRQLNPQGKAPVLVHNKHVINESGAIINYIASLAPEVKLIPNDDLILRAYYDEICFFTLSDLEQSLWTYGKHSFALPKAQRVKEVRVTAHWEFAKSVNALDHYVSGKTYIVGEQFSMADILVAHTLQWANKVKFDMPESLLAYANTLYEREACQRALAALA